MQKSRKRKLNIENQIRVAMLNDSDIQKAQERVWQKISLEIDSDIKQDLSFATLFKRYAYFFCFVFIFVLLGFIGFSQNQTNTSLNVASNDIQQENIQNLAAKRFAELNGVTFEEYQNVISTIEPQTESTSENNLRIDFDKASELIKKLDKQRKIRTFYSEKKLVIYEPEKFAALQNNFNIKKYFQEKELNIKEWQSINKSKTVITSENGTLLYFLKDGRSTLEYYGGDFALETIVNNYNIQIAGLTSEGKELVNPEVSLMKKILSDETIKINQVDNHLIAQLDIDRNIRILYSLNPNDLSLLKESYFIEDTLIYELISINNEVIINEEKYLEIFSKIDFPQEIKVRSYEFPVNPDAYFSEANSSISKEPRPVFSLESDKSDYRKLSGYTSKVFEPEELIEKSKYLLYKDSLSFNVDGLYENINNINSIQYIDNFRIYQFSKENPEISLDAHTDESINIELKINDTEIEVSAVNENAFFFEVENSHYLVISDEKINKLNLATLDQGNLSALEKFIEDYRANTVEFKKVTPAPNSRLESLLNSIQEDYELADLQKSLEKEQLSNCTEIYLPIDGKNFLNCKFYSHEKSFFQLGLMDSSKNKYHAYILDSELPGDLFNEIRENFEIDKFEKNGYYIYVVSI
jgi:hypothetical protein